MKPGRKPLLMMLLLTLSLILPPAVSAAGSFDLNQFISKVRQRIKWTGGRDTWLQRVPRGESCVQASQDRGREIAAVIKSMQFNGQFGDYSATVGTVSGWNPGIGSLHTYNVVQIKDKNGRVIYTLDVDNYMGPVYISAHGPVDWSSNYNQKLEDIVPAPSAPQAPPPTPKPAAPKPTAPKPAKPATKQPAGETAQAKEARIVAEFRSLYPRFLEKTKSPGNRVEVVANAVKTGENKWHIKSQTWCPDSHKKGQMYRCASFEGYSNLGQLQAAVNSYKKVLGIK